MEIWVTGLPTEEILDFRMRYAQRLMGTDPRVAAEQMAAALAMYPGLKDAMGKMQANSADLDGTSILTTLTSGRSTVYFPLRTPLSGSGTPQFVGAHGHGAHG
jgi:hypothetical protein